MITRPLLLAVLLAAPVSAYADDVCRDDTQCEPWSVCSVSLGDCQAGAGDLDVCTGICVSGDTIRLVARGGVFAVEDGGVHAVAGGEIVLPWWQGRLSAVFDYLTPDRGRVGGALRLITLPGVAASLRGDWIFGGAASVGAASLRLDGSPARFIDVPPFRWTSLFIEGGVVWSEPRAPYLAAGLAIWPPPPLAKLR